jgi:hypothetical protein
MKSKVYKELNKDIKSILLITDGWLVGNAVKNITEDK